MLYSLMDIGGHSLNGYLTRRYNSFKVAKYLGMLSILLMSVKLTNIFMGGSNLVNMVSTFSTVLFTSTVVSVCILNHTKVIRPDLSFISVDSAIAFGAFVS